MSSALNTFSQCGGMTEDHAVVSWLRCGWLTTGVVFALACGIVLSCWEVHQRKDGGSRSTDSDNGRNILLFVLQTIEGRADGALTTREVLTYLECVFLEASLESHTASVGRHLKEAYFLRNLLSLRGTAAVRTVLEELLTKSSKLALEDVGRLLRHRFQDTGGDSVAGTSFITTKQWWSESESETPTAPQSPPYYRSPDRAREPVMECL